MEVALRRLPTQQMRRRLCVDCLRRVQKRSTPGAFRHLGLQNSDRLAATQRHSSGTSSSASRRQGQDQEGHDQQGQASPLDGYYQLLLDQPLYGLAASATRPAPEHNQHPSAKRAPNTESDDRVARARVVFGSRLAGPAERRSEIDRASTRIAGVLVPPRPDEPDNCCMSGCANCVWDRYRDEIEEWAAKSNEARAAIKRERIRGNGTGLMVEGAAVGGATHAAVSMDDDGGGSEANWNTGLEVVTGEAGDLFGGIPVGIREFMRTEKRLKERHRQEGSVGG